MASLNLLQLYYNILTKQLVNVGGSLTSIPDLYYGDLPAVAIYPVTPISSNPAQGYQSFDMTGYTMKLTMADAPNAQNPPTPFAFIDGMIFTKPASGFYYFGGNLDLTQAATGTFIGNNAARQAYFNLDVFDSSLNRTTFLQTTFNMKASIDQVNPAPGGGGGANLYPTLNQLKNIFVQIQGPPGAYQILTSEDGTKKMLIGLGNDGKLLDGSLN